jgi:hypothetical protein
VLALEAALSQAGLTCSDNGRTGNEVVNREIAVEEHNCVLADGHTLVIAIGQDAVGRDRWTGYTLKFVDVFVIGPNWAISTTFQKTSKEERTILEPVATALHAGLRP